jgi:predicted O-linked N-acetylglucosamine transferase (SPINDLY family)
MLDMRDEHARATMRARLEHHGIPATRFTLRGRESTHEYYRTIGAFDIALDTFPHNGATTTLDTLWMGVPIVGLRGERGISRASYSILMSLGVPELIAESDSAYVECNVRLAKDVNWRIELQATLRDRLEASPLMDASQFTRDLEAAYRTMWRNWCAGSRGQCQAIEI